MEENRRFVGFVRRLRGDATLRQELMANPTGFCQREGLAAPAAAALLRLIPHLTVASSEVPPQPGTFTWWF